MITCRKCGEVFAVHGSAQTIVKPSNPGKPTPPTVITGKSSGAKKDDLIGELIGGCRLEKKLGQGGMGAVYLAHHLALDIPVAVKILPPQFASANQTAVDRFVREARAAARLKHHNIVGVMNVGQERGLNFIVMDFVDGESLQDVLDRKQAMAPESAIDVIIQACNALELARENNIVHRDIKPDNVMIDQKGVVKLADLGLAKQTEDELSVTQSGMAMGTPHYMSPEQANDARSADHRSDIYSLGCMFYRMVAGRVPFDDQSIYKILTKHMQDDIPDVRSINPSVPENIAGIIKKCMAKDPADRYQKASELIDDLNRARTGQNTVASQLMPHKSMAVDARPGTMKKVSSIQGKGRKSSRRMRATGQKIETKRNNAIPLVAGIGAIILITGIAIGVYLSGGDDKAKNDVQRPPVPVQTAKVPEQTPPPPPPPPPSRPEPAQNDVPPPDVPSTGKIINMIPHIEAGRCTLDGRWWGDDKTITSDNYEFAKLQIPYIPPREYDFRLVFRRLERPEGVVQLFPCEKGQTGLVMGAQDNIAFGLAGFNGGENLPLELPAGLHFEFDKKHESIVKVRKTHVEIYIDSVLVKEIKTEAEKADAKLPPRLYMGRKSILGLVTLGCPTEFTVIEVKEISGAGEFVEAIPPRHQPMDRPENMRGPDGDNNNPQPIRRPRRPMLEKWREKPEE
ncbi:MAG: serine/threonine protein kinase [Planctomycetes bacterium]|nr:serine/threonine protein kinase [Planctomycetota bacterium]